MSKILLILTAFASVTLGNTSARAESPEQYVRAKYGKHDLLLAEKKPSQLVPLEIAYLQGLGMRWDPVQKCWWGFSEPLHSSVLSPVRGPSLTRSPGPHWIYWNETKVFRYVDDNGEIHQIVTYMGRYDQASRTYQVQLANGRWVTP